MLGIKITIKNMLKMIALVGTRKMPGIKIMIKKLLKIVQMAPMQVHQASSSLNQPGTWIYAPGQFDCVDRRTDLHLALC